MTARSLRIHGPNGVVERPAQLPDLPPTRRRATISNAVPLTNIMSRNVVCAAPTLELATLVEVMVRDHLGCMPVIDERDHPIGMVTKLDLVEQLTTPITKPYPTVSDIMMPLAITLDDHATVAHAAALMASEDMHHVMVVSSGVLIGVVSTMDITRWLAANDGIMR